MIQGPENHAPEQPQKRRGWTKARAVLAGGLVLGVGAAITLAAWTDQEWVKGVFGSGTFGIEGAVDGETFSDHASEDRAAELSFEMDADTLTPGDSVYAGYSVQLESDSDYEANVVLATDASAALAGTTSSFVYTTEAECDATAFAEGTRPGATTFSLSAPETPTHLCFQVTAENTLAQGQEGEFVWTFTATSGDRL